VQCWFGLRSSSSTYTSIAALDVVFEEFLVGNSHRTVRFVELVRLKHRSSNCNTINSGGVGEGWEMVGVSDGHHGEVLLTVKVVMVIMTSDGTPMGEPRSRGTGK